MLPVEPEAALGAAARPHGLKHVPAAHRGGSVRLLPRAHVRWEELVWESDPGSVIIGTTCIVDSGHLLVWP